MGELINLLRERFGHREFEQEVSGNMVCSDNCFRCRLEAANKIDERELRELRYWKRASMRQWSAIDLQAIGRILNLKCGDTIGDKIIPALLEKGNGRLCHCGSYHYRSAS